MEKSVSVRPELINGINWSNSISKFFFLAGFSALSVCVCTRVFMGCTQDRMSKSTNEILPVRADASGSLPDHFLWKKWKCFLVPLAEEPEPHKIPDRIDQGCPEQLKYSAPPALPAEPAATHRLFPMGSYRAHSSSLFEPNLKSLKVFALIPQVQLADHPSNTRKCCFGKYTLPIK